MDTNYTTILYKYFFQDSIFYIVLFALCLIFVIVEFIKKKRKKVIIAELIIMIFALAGVLTVLIPVGLDISKNNIVQVNYSTGYLYTQSTHKSISLATPYLFETDSNYNIELSVVDGMPKKIKDGTIIYSKHSKVLLEYSGVDDSDNW